MSSSSAANKVDVLVLGPSNHIGVEIGKILTGYQPYNLLNYNSIDKLMAASETEINPLLAIVSADKDTTATCEWVQTAKMSYPHVPILVLHDSGSTLNHWKAQKNGASYVMHLFYDQEFISDRILQLAPVELDGDHIPLNALVAINADDFEPGTKIEFNLYVHLPSNQKTILFRRAGALLDDKAISKIKSSAGQRVYVKKTQLKLFFVYASSVLKLRKAQDVISQTEKLQKSKSEIQTIMSYFLDEEDSGYEHGKKILERCDVILNELGLNQNLTSEQIFFKLVAHNGQNQSIYNDCVNLCTYSVLFAKMLDLDNESVRTIALAGLLANIGLAGLPRELNLKPRAKWSKDDLDTFQKYPFDSVTMIKKKKVPLPQEVAKIIEQHREHLDGSGFPTGAKGTQLNKLSRIISLAYRFQTLTSLQDDKQSFSPLAAIEQITKENIGNKMIFDAIILQAVNAFIKIHSQRLANNKVA